MKTVITATFFTGTDGSSNIQLDLDAFPLPLPIRKGSEDEISRNCAYCTFALFVLLFLAAFPLRKKKKEESISNMLSLHVFMQ